MVIPTLTRPVDIRVGKPSRAVISASVARRTFDSMFLPTGAVLLGAAGDGDWYGVFLDDDGVEMRRERIAAANLATWVAEREASHDVRWIVRSLRDSYPQLLQHGVRVRRAHDLLLCHAILRDTASLSHPLAFDSAWLRSEPTSRRTPSDTLFVFEHDEGAKSESIEGLLEEYSRQRAVISKAPDGRLALLCAAESTGALIAEEMTAAGLPWDPVRHEEILIEALGDRPREGSRPQKMAERATQIQSHLNDPTLNPDSAQRVLRALHRAGIMVESTSQWELREIDHPVIEPLLAYKKMARLLSANGWAWLSEWVHDRRMRPVYLTGGVVTGRWASAGGGALQIPRTLRPCVRADEGWALIIADVAQLEPRVLAALSRDTAMAEAGRGVDLYNGIVRSGVVKTREEAKYAVLGAMYGATTGDSGRLAPRLRNVFPRAMALVDDAARVGERGGAVSTLLGRSTPAPDAEWQRTQSQASAPEAGAIEERRARGHARERGRFTRNFVVQGTAAEWSLLWLAEIRHRLWSLPVASVSSVLSGPVFAERAHLAFFLHDEIIVHTPVEQAAAAAKCVREAADAATKRLFPGFAIDIPLDLRIAESAAKQP